MKNRTKLQQVGWWATLWWGVSCAYVLLLVWLAADTYADISESADSQGFFSDWQSAVSSIYAENSYLPALLGFIIVVWIIGGIIWLKELKKQKISYKAAFKDLFLTIRK